MGGCCGAESKSGGALGGIFKKIFRKQNTGKDWDHVVVAVVVVGVPFQIIDVLF